MIDEKRLLEEIKDWQDDIHDNELDDSKFDFVFDRIYEIVKEQPRVNEWIPVEERLPNIAGYPCLCTIENMYGQRKVAKLFTNYGIKPFWLSNEKDIDLSVWKVIAWQPLPKPYVKE